MNSLIIAMFVSLNPKVYSINHHTLNVINEVHVKSKSTLRGVSTTTEVT